MLKRLLILIGFLFIGHVSSAQMNVTFRSHLTFPGATLANIGGYVDSVGNEYALVGYQFGLSIVNVSNPDSPWVAFTVPGPTSEWREVKTWQHYGYVTTEGPGGGQLGNGLQVVNLGYLPDSVQYHSWFGDSTIAGQMNTIHALHIDNGYAYLYGSNLFGGAAIIASLSDPWNPHFVGRTNTTYIHDGYVRNDTLWAAHIYDGYFSVIDVHDKANPNQMMAQNTPTNFTHNTWLNDAGSVLFTTDENSNSYLASYDVHDINNIQELDRIQLTPGSGSIVHNTHTLNDYEIVSWYKDGIAIVDASHPDNMVVTGWYDTDTLESGDGFNGCWGVYPFLPSGNLVASDITGGLYVLTPNYVRGCYLEGLITDSVTTSALQSVSVEIISTPVAKQNKITGFYKTGYESPGTYSVRFKKAGYKVKVVTGVVLQRGIVTTLNVALEPLVPFTLTGHISDASNSNPVANAQVSLKNDLYNYSTTTNASGDFSISNFYEGNYDFTAGKWSYHTTCSTLLNVTSSTTVQGQLTPGYADDFSFDFGWTVSGNNSTPWQLGVPIGTTYNNVQSAPGADVTNDCGNQCYVTDNLGGSALSSDVDGPATVLTSPVFDLTNVVNPVILLDYWYYDVATTFGPPNDTLFIKLNDGTTTVTLEKIDPTSPTMGAWTSRSYTVSSFLTPTATMRLSVSISDTPPVYNLTEAGLDNFSITSASGLNTNAESGIQLAAFPNPSHENFEVRYLIPERSVNATLEIRDITGRLMESHTGLTGQGSITTSANWPAGSYLATFKKENGSISTLKLMKIK